MDTFQCIGAPEAAEGDQQIEISPNHLRHHRLRSDLLQLLERQLSEVQRLPSDPERVIWHSRTLHEHVQHSLTPVPREACEHATEPHQTEKLPHLNTVNGDL